MIKNNVLYFLEGAQMKSLLLFFQKYLRKQFYE